MWIMKIKLPTKMYQEVDTGRTRITLAEIGEFNWKKTKDGSSIKHILC